MQSQVGTSMPPQGAVPGKPQQPQQQRVPLAKEKNPVAIHVATAIRHNKLLKQRSGILTSTKNKADFFRFKRFVRAIQSDDFKKKLAKADKNLPPIPDKIEAINQIFIMLIQNQLIIPVEKLKTKDAKAKGIKIDKQTPALEPSSKAVLQPDAYYVWAFTPPNPYMLLYSILGICVVFAVILFPLWPFWMRKGVWYLSTSLLVFVGLFFVTAIIRLIIYLITLATMKNQLWLFPNLFEDCGVLESFQPFYAWEDSSSNEKKKKKVSKNKVAKSQIESSDSISTNTNESTPAISTKSTSSKIAETSTKKRVATVEDVD
ncbi:Translocation protein S62 [Pichia californica]|uniref:Translocation protein SEC62 n=1 Tax=Pichia californica TaxID=460514 RepID=A0A9P7BHE9_9ASCO|nr:Translocation protein S62 [[Candida] californica]KAG0690410.1 Translocation protein S62 [[Candida] californica]